MPSAVAMRREQNRRLSPLERFLLGEGGSELPPLDHLRVAGLAGHSYVKVESDPARNALRPDFHEITLRHMRVRAELALLLKEWAGAGVEALVFKGFYLAEFVYPSFGQRPYADIDLLVPPEQIDAACRAAEELKWELCWRAGEPDHMLAARAPDYHGHEAAQLRHRELKILVDLHRRIVHNNHNHLRPGRPQSDLTKAVWRESIATMWEGVRLRLPQPVDAVLFGLVLNRCWGSDEWQVKPRDYPDLQALVARFGLTRDELVERARSLGIERTLGIYLDRCDPFRSLLNLGRPTWLELRRWNLKIAPERGRRDLERGVLAARSLLSEFVEIVAALPLVLRVLHLRSQGKGPAEIEARLDRTKHSAATLGFREWRGIRRGIHRCLRLLRCQGPERELAAYLAACSALKLRGLACSVELKADRLALLVDGQLIEDVSYLVATPPGD